MEEFKNILYPIALSEISSKVAPYVVTLARQLDASVHLIHVLRRFDWFVENFLSELPQPDFKRSAGDSESQGQHQAQQFLSELSGSDFKRIASGLESQVQHQAQQKLEAFKQRYLRDIRIAATVVVSGTRHKRILEYVKSEGIDLIIMGAGTPLQKLMFGSVVEKVSKLATVPVTIVKCV